MLISQFMEREFKHQYTQRPQWTEIPRKVINQAVRGNNIGPFARKVCEMYGLKYDPHKITEYEISKFKIYPDTSFNIYSMKEELERSTLRAGKLVSYTEPVVTEKELKELGFKTSSFFRKNPVADDLLACTNTYSLLRKTKDYFESGKITEHQAKELTKRVILTLDGADEKSCDLATTKFLKTDLNDIKKAVKFYEKEDFEIKTQIDHQQKISLEVHENTQTLKIDETIKIK